MSMRVGQPVGQKRLTNIAVVRFKKGGQRFEVACYKNKVGDWRTGIEKDLDEVLQTVSIFHNVGKGIVAKAAELQAAFGTTDNRTICLEILARGELQVSEGERKVEFDNLFKDVASVLVEKCVDPGTGRPYTLTMLERALHDAHFSIDPKRSAKQQALEALPLLQKSFPIERARMRLRLTVPTEHHAALLDEVASARDHIIEATEHSAASTSLTAQVEPGVFRELHNFMQQVTGGKGRIEVLSMAVTADATSAQAFAASQPAALSDAATAPSRTATAARAADTQSSPDAKPCTTSGRTDPETNPRGDAAAGPPSKKASSSGGGVAGTPEGAGANLVVYPRGPLAGLPEQHAARRERFAELDTLQPGWQVELRTKGDSVEAVFFSPAGEVVGSYANARRQALLAHKQAGKAVA